jgi:plasmid stability protein
MGEVRVRDLDEGVVSALKDRARRHGKSLSEELREMLTREAFRPRQETIDRLQQLRDDIRAECGVLPDSTPFIRTERDRRG